MSIKDDVLEVQKVFPNAYCTSYKDKFCIAFSFEEEPIIATAKKPSAAWKAAARLVKGKSKKQIEKLKRELLISEAKNTKALL